MPNYAYKCVECCHEFDVIVPYNDRSASQECFCGGVAEYYPAGSFTRAMNATQSFYDEGLGCDVSGERERRQIMGSQGVRESGDAVGGARNVLSTAVGRQAPKGVRYSDIQYKADRAEKIRQNTVVAFRNNDGTERTTRHEDNSSDTKKAFKVRHNF